MTTHTETIQYIECDICYMRDMCEEQVIVNGKVWDVCSKCYENFNAVMTFLDIAVGLNIDWKLRGTKK